MAVRVEVFVGDTFETADLVTLETEIFGLVSVVEREVDVTCADLARDVVVDDAVEVEVLVELTRDVVPVAVAGLVKVLQKFLHFD